MIEKNYSRPIPLTHAVRHNIIHIHNIIHNIHTIHGLTEKILYIFRKELCNGETYKYDTFVKCIQRLFAPPSSKTFVFSAIDPT